MFDVHINRAPIGGRVAKVDYHKGEFLPAFDHKASTRNEQNTVTIADGDTRVVFKQIAGSSPGASSSTSAWATRWRGASAWG